MEEKVLTLCQTFIENRDAIKKVFGMDSIYIYPIAANALTANGVKADVEKLKSAKKIISKNAGVLSYLKGNVSTPFAANISFREDPKAYFDKVVKFYNLIKKQFSRSEYTALLAIILADTVDEDSISSVVSRGVQIYRLMKEQHPFLTNEKDSVLAGLLALSEKDNTELVEDMEKCYDLLRIKFSDKSSIHTVAHILALTESSAREKVERLIELYDVLREKGKKYGQYTELAALAAVSILDDNTEGVADTIIEIDDFLAKQKGYGLLGLDKKTRMMHATLLTADLYDTAKSSSETLSGADIAMMAAQQIAICAVITAAGEVIYAE
jgi:hypothetical protein